MNPDSPSHPPLLVTRVADFLASVPADQNGGVPNHKGSGWRGFCKFPPKKEISVEGGPVRNLGGYDEATIIVSTMITLNVMSYTWTNVKPPAGDRYGLTANVCRPSVLTKDVRFAIMTDDPYYGNLRVGDFNLDPGTRTIGVKRPDYKRYELAEGFIVVDEGNSTRLASDEEIETELGYTKCKRADCAEELDTLRQQQARAGAPTAISEPWAPTAEGSELVAITTVIATVATRETLSSRPSLTAYLSSKPTKI